MCVSQERIQKKDMQSYKIREIAFGGGTKFLQKMDSAIYDRASSGK